MLNTNYPDFEVVFVDNASTDGSPELVEERFGSDPRLNIIKSDENLGFTLGNDVGFEHSKGDYVVFLNVDTRVNREWLSELIEVMESDETIGAAQGKLLKLYDDSLIDSVGGFVSPIGYGPLRVADQGPFDRVSEIFYAEGAAIIVRRSVVEDASVDGQPFDPDYFIYYCETDLCWRIRLRGCKVVLVPTSIAYHARSYGVPHEAPPNSVFLSTKNRLATLTKNYGPRNLVKYLPLLLFFEALRALFFLRMGKGRSSTAIVRAILWNMRNLKRTWRRRVIVQTRVRTVADELILRKMLPLGRVFFDLLLLVRGRLARVPLLL